LKARPKKIRTFTVGFDGDQVIDERPYARLVAEKFGTEHYDLSITSQDFWIFCLPTFRTLEEPVCEPPAVALYYVSKLARKHVKALLSGEGGDEAFGGYPTYPNMMRLAQIGQAAGPFARMAGAGVALAGRISADAARERYGEALGQPLSSQYSARTAGPTTFFNRNARRFLTPAFLRDTESVSAARYIASLTETCQMSRCLTRCSMWIQRRGCRTIS